MEDKLLYPQIAFYKGVLDRKFTIYWIYILKYLKNKGKVSAQIIREDVGASKLNTIIPEIVNAGFIESDDNYLTYWLSNDGIRFLEKLDDQKLKCKKRLKDWLSRQLKHEASEVDIEKFVNLTYEWQAEELELFFRILVNMEKVENFSEGDNSGHNDSYTPRLNKIVTKIKSGLIRDNIITQLLLHSFIWWISNRYINNYTQPENTLGRILETRQKTIILDTNVLIGATVEHDLWYRTTKHLIKMLKDNKDNLRIKVVILGSTMKELRYALSKIGTEALPLLGGVDSSQMLASIRKNISKSVYLDFLRKSGSARRGYDSYLVSIERKLSLLKRDLNITLIKESDIVYTKDAYDEMMLTCKNHESQTRQRASTARIRHKILLFLYANRCKKNGEIPLIWTYHSKISDYERKLFKYPMYGVNAFLLKSILLPKEVLDAGEIDKIRELIGEYRLSLESIDETDLNRLKETARKLWIQFSGKNEEVIHGPFAVDSAINKIIREISKQEYDYEKEPGSDNDEDLDYIFTS